MIAAHWGELRSHFVWVYLMQQVGLYGLLGLAFGRTLARGSVPLCTQMAIRVHGSLAEDALRYTRHVTLAWTAFFAITTLALLVLFVAAPLRAWSAFANFGAPLAIVAMFMVENAIRYRALPGMQHAGLIATLEASAAVGVAGIRAPVMNARELRRRVARRAAGCYRRSGPWAYFFATCKLRYDPFYAVLLTEGLIPCGMRILDLGCAQGLLASWLLAARQTFAEGTWDSHCPAPACMENYRGVDRNESEIRRARQALGAHGEFVAGDIAAEPISGATLVVLLDVLHYLDFASQVGLLRRIRAALPAQGVLLLRVGDSDGSLPARISQWVDRCVSRLRGASNATLSRRRLAEWISLLNDVGFNVHEVARQRSPGYVNCVLRALPRPA
jgi:SAM-dependent methyltransferase